MRKPLPFGAKGELAARKHLRSRGHRILDTNYTHKLGELDIVSEHNGSIVFTEVKARTKSEGFRPADNLGPAKIRKLRRIAEIYLKHRALTDRPVQFDVIELVYPAGGRRKPKIDHFERAF
jgi:putative endonuclease